MLKTLGILAVVLLSCTSGAWANAREARECYAKGARLEKAGRYGEAIEQFKAAEQAEPSMAAADREIGNCYYRLGDRRRAWEYYERYLGVYPDDVKYRAFADSIRPKGDSSYAGALTLNPVELIIGAADAQYEQRLNLESSLCYRLFLWDLSLADTSFSAFGLGAAYRMYPGHNALHYFYWGPGVSLLDVSVKLSDPEAGVSGSGSGVVFGPSIEAGWQFVPFDAFAIDLGVSLTYYVGDVSASAGGVSSSAAFSGLDPGFRLGMGYAWH